MRVIFVNSNHDRRITLWLIEVPSMRRSVIMKTTVTDLEDIVNILISYTPRWHYFTGFHLIYSSIEVLIIIRESNMVLYSHQSKFVVNVYRNVKIPCYETFAHLIFSSHNSTTSPVPI